MPRHALPPPSPQEIARAASNAFLAKLDAAADPSGNLPPEERAEQVKAVRRRHFTALGRAGGLAKAKNAAATQAGGQHGRR